MGILDYEAVFSHIKCRRRLGSRLKIMDAGQRATYQEGGALVSHLLLLALAPKCADGAFRDLEGVRRREGAAPAEDSGRRCHLALTQGESGTYSLTVGAAGGGKEDGLHEAIHLELFFSLTQLCIYVICS